MRKFRAHSLKDQLDTEYVLAELKLWSKYAMGELVQLDYEHKLNELKLRFRLISKLWAEYDGIDYGV